MEFIVLLAFPGFLAVWVHRLYARRRSRTNWDFLVLSGLAGVTSYVFATHIVRLITGRESESAFLPFTGTTPGIHQIDGVSYAVSFPVAAALGFLSYLMFYHPFVTTYLVEVFNVRHPPDEADLLSEISEIEASVVISMTNGQVYIGRVQAVSKDPDQDHRLIALAYFLSGARGKTATDKAVTYNYAVEYDRDRPSTVYLDFRQVVSILEFDFRNFMASLKSKYAALSSDGLRSFLSSLEATGQITKDEMKTAFQELASG